MKQERGITLVALVVTVIILMILAGEAEAMQLNQLYYELESRIKIKNSNFKRLEFLCRQIKKENKTYKNKEYRKSGFFFFFGNYCNFAKKTI